VASHRKSKVTASAVSRSEWLRNVCKTITDAIAPPEWADAPTRPEQVLERVTGEQLIPMIGEQLEHRTRQEHMRGQRFDIQKLTLTIMTTPHNPSLNPQPVKSHHRALTVQINQQSPRTCRISSWR